MSSDNLSYRFKQEFVDTMKDLPDIFVDNELGRVVYERTYSRVKSDGTNEVWWESIKRVVEGCFSLLKDYNTSTGQQWDDDQAHEMAQEMYHLMYNMKFLPPGRGLWAMGSDIIHKKKLGLSLFNCSFVSTEKILDDPCRPFCVGMDMLMLGVGLGADTKGAGKIKLYEPIMTPNQMGLTYVTVEDTREGWVRSLEHLLLSYFIKDSPVVEFDYSLIRKKGTQLKTFGGVASGPEPLIEMHNEIDKVLRRELKNGYLSSTGITDIYNLIGSCVVSGNIRRSAELILGEEDDEQFLDLKNYEKNPHRMSYGWASNNSVLPSIGRDYSDIQNRICNNGEPGIIWLENMRKYSRMCDPPDWRDRRVLGTNPCFPIDTMITTSNGLQSIKELLGNPFVAVIDGKEYPSTNQGFFQTAQNHQLYKIELENGISVRATDNHKFLTNKGMIELTDLSKGDTICLSDNYGYKWENKNGTFEEGYLMGLLIGDGTFEGLQKGSEDIRKARIAMWINKEDYTSPEEYDPFRYTQYILHNTLDHRNNKNFNGMNLCKETDKFWEYRGSMVAINEIAQRYNIKPLEKNIYESGSYEFTQGMLQGLFDTDGTVICDHTKGCSIRLCQSNLQRLESVQRLLFAMGITSTIYENRRKEGFRNMPDGNGGLKEYYCQSSHELVVSCQSIQYFHEIVGFKDNKKREKLENILNSYTRNMNKSKFTSKINSITKDTIEDVYCCTIPGPHKIVANGIKASNCGEISLDSYEVCNLNECFPARHLSLKEFKRTLKYSFLYSKIVTLAPIHITETQDIVKINRRIGNSMSGIAQFIAKFGIEELRIWCKQAYSEIQRWDAIYSKWLKVPRSIKTTTVKPSGTVSLLASATPGVHYPHSRYYIRRVRMTTGSPQLEKLRSKGYYIEPCVFKPEHTAIVEFPVDVGKCRTLDDVTMWEQLELAAFMQHYYADNQVSCTVTFQKEEGQHIAAALNTYQYRLKGISFLPRSDDIYPQMPYEKISKEQYEKMCHNITERSRGHVTAPLGGQKRKRDEMSESLNFCDGDTCTLNL